MADEKVEGSTLRKFVQTGQKLPLMFAFNLGPDNTLFMLIDRRKEPGFLIKVAEKEGGSDNAEFATFELNDSTIKLTCRRQISGLNVAPKKFRKGRNMSVNVLISDKNGKEITDKPICALENPTEFTGFEQMSSKTGVMFEYLDNIDCDLKQTPKSQVKSPGGPDRKSLKSGAVQIVDTYRDVLVSKYFPKHRRKQICQNQYPRHRSFLA